MEWKLYWKEVSCSEPETSITYTITCFLLFLLAELYRRIALRLQSWEVDHNLCAISSGSIRIHWFIWGVSDVVTNNHVSM